MNEGRVEPITIPRHPEWCHLGKDYCGWSTIAASVEDEPRYYRDDIVETRVDLARREAMEEAAAEVDRLHRLISDPLVRHYLSMASGRIRGIAKRETA